MILEQYNRKTSPNIYGLKIRIARELLSENLRDSIPPDLLGFYLSKRVKKELRFPKILRKKSPLVATNF